MVYKFHAVFLNHKPRTCISARGGSRGGGGGGGGDDEGDHDFKIEIQDIINAIKFCWF